MRVSSLLWHVWDIFWIVISCSVKWWQTKVLVHIQNLVQSTVEVSPKILSDLIRKLWEILHFEAQTVLYWTGLDCMWIMPSFPYRIQLQNGGAFTFQPHRVRLQKKLSTGGYFFIRSVHKESVCTNKKFNVYSTSW